MKNFIILCFILLSVTIQAQELVLKSFESDVTGLAARSSAYAVKDINNKYCAVIRVVVALQDVNFSANSLVKQEYNKNEGEYRIYVSPGTKNITVSHPEYKSLSIDFPKKLEEKKSYILVLERSDMNLPAAKIRIESNVTGADVIIDDLSFGVTPCTVELTNGEHNLVLRKKGYNEEKTKIEVKVGDGIKQRPVFVQMYQEGTFTYEGISYEMVNVQGGSFYMGSPEKPSGSFSYEHPIHEVEVSNFSIGRTEVTQALWKAVMGNNPSTVQGDNLPVNNISWEDCQEFITQLNEITGKSFRLPTEAEWEYAAKGGSRQEGTNFAGSNSLSQVSRQGNIYPVASLKPNVLGIHDMSGNVSEWCQDWLGRYEARKVFNPKGAERGVQRIHRGGGFDMEENFHKVYTRNYSRPKEVKASIGLRLVTDKE